MYAIRSYYDGFANVTVKPAGVTGTFRMNLPYEVQCTLPYAVSGVKADEMAETEESFKHNLKNKYAFTDEKYAKSVKKYQTFPKELTRSEYKKLVSESAYTAPLSDNIVSVGLDYVDFNPVCVDLEKSHVVAIYGKKEFGKTNLLNILLTDFLKQKPNARVVLV